MKLCALTYLVSLIRTMQKPITPVVQSIQQPIIAVRLIKTKVSEQLINNYYIYIQLMYTYSLA